MAAQDKQRSSAIQWAGLGVEAIRAGRFADGRDHLVRALRLDKANPFYHFDLALAHHGLGDIEEAARELCTAIRLKPDFDDASRRLGMLCARYLFESDGVLDGFALRTAMQAPRASQQALAEAAISELARHGSLAQPLAAIAREGADATARNLLTKRTDDALRDDTLLAALEWGVNKNLTVERMLTALRRAVLLDVPPGRFEDKALQAFTIALAKHCVANEHVWAETPEETAAIEHLKPLLTGLPLGEFQATRAVLLIALYRPLSSFLPAGQTSAVKLRALRDWAAESLKNEQAEIALAKTLTAGPLPGDATGKRVAQQYEKAPYPRWTSLTMPNTGSLKLALRQFFSPDRLTFLGACHRRAAAFGRTLSSTIARTRAAAHAATKPRHVGPPFRPAAVEIGFQQLPALRLASAALAPELRELGARQRRQVSASVGARQHVARQRPGALIERHLQKGCAHTGEARAAGEGLCPGKPALRTP